MTEVKYPKVEVKMISPEVGEMQLYFRVANALLKAGVARSEVDEYRVEFCKANFSTGGHVALTRKWVALV